MQASNSPRTKIVTPLQIVAVHTLSELEKRIPQLSYKLTHTAFRYSVFYAVVKHDLSIANLQFTQDHLSIAFTGIVTHTWEPLGAVFYFSNPDYVEDICTYLAKKLPDLKVVDG